jgi:hypothetical protein
MREALIKSTESADELQLVRKLMNEYLTEQREMLIAAGAILRAAPGNPSTA